MRGWTLAALVTVAFTAGCGGGEGTDGAPTIEVTPEQTTLIQLWKEGTPAFGIFVPSERERGATGPTASDFHLCIRGPVVSDSPRTRCWTTSS